MLSGIVIGSGMAAAATGGINTINLYVDETKVIDSNSSTFAITGNVGIDNTAPRLGENKCHTS